MEKDMAIQKIKLKIGTVYQKEPNGVYYFRYQVNGARKAISLKTRNKQEARSYQGSRKARSSFAGYIIRSYSSTCSIRP